MERLWLNGINPLMGEEIPVHEWIRPGQGHAYPVDSRIGWSGLARLGVVHKTSKPPVPHAVVQLQRLSERCHLCLEDSGIRAL